jgi:hypothetical protein
MRVVLGVCYMELQGERKWRSSCDCMDLERENRWHRLGEDSTVRQVRWWGRGLLSSFVPCFLPPFTLLLHPTILTLVYIV